MDTHFCTHSFVQQTESNQRWNYQVFCEAVVFQLCKQYQCRWACGWMRVFMYVIRSRLNNAIAWTQVKARGIVSKLCIAECSHTLCRWYNKQTNIRGHKDLAAFCLGTLPSKSQCLSVSSFTYKNHPAWISCFPPVHVICAHSINLPWHISGNIKSNWTLSHLFISECHIFFAQTS